MREIHHITKTKRTAVLQHAKEEHREVLQLCHRIRKGLSDNIEIYRIRSYTDWFFEHYLEPHFSEEAKLILCILGPNVRVKRALANHRRILKILSCSCENLRVLSLLEEELSAYIRYEEKVLYREMVSVATDKQLLALQEHRRLVSKEAQWDDRFWEE